MVHQPLWGISESENLSMAFPETPNENRRVGSGKGITKGDANNTITTARKKQPWTDKELGIFE